GRCVSLIREVECSCLAVLYRLPKVISGMVGQTCRFAATTRRSSPTFSEVYFGNWSKMHARQDRFPSHPRFSRSLCARGEVRLASDCFASEVCGNNLLSDGS